MMKLYWSPRSRSFSALWLMEETGQPYERVLTDISKGAQKTPEYLAINPMGKVPALSDGEATLAEAAAICAYVAERYPEAKLAPPVGDPLRAKYLYWLFFAPGCVEPAMVQVATKIEMNPVAAGWGDAQRVFDVLDAALAKGPWLLGDAFSAADIVIGSGLNFAVRLFKMVPSRPSFDRYIDRCAARPAFQRGERDRRRMRAGKSIRRILQLFRPRHQDDVVAGIDVVNLTGNAAGQFDNRYSAEPPSSSSVTPRPSGECFCIKANIARESPMTAPASVRTGPAEIALTRMLRGPKSAAR